MSLLVAVSQHGVLLGVSGFAFSTHEQREVSLQEKQQEPRPEDAEEGERLEDDLLHAPRVGQDGRVVQFFVLERATGIEPVTVSLEGWCSTY